MVIFNSYVSLPEGKVPTNRHIGFNVIETSNIGF